MAESIDNVVIGSGKLYLADTTAALPTITGTLGTDITWTNWSDPGFLAKDIELKFGEETKDFTPRGSLAPMKTAIVKREVSGKFTIAEADIDALALSLGLEVSSNTLSDGGDDLEPVYKAMAIETPLAVYHFKKVRIKGDFSEKLADYGVPHFLDR